MVCFLAEMKTEQQPLLQKSYIYYNASCKPLPCSKLGSALSLTQAQAGPQCSEPAPGVSWSQTEHQPTQNELFWAVLLAEDAGVAETEVLTQG